MEERLQKFASLVDAGSFTGAANELHLSQPALSAAISKLERELHATLLLRGSRPLKLTPAGEVAYAHAKETAVRTGNLKLQIAQAVHEKIAVRVGMIDSLADALFERGSGLADLEQQVAPSLIVDNSRYLTRAVARNEIDIAFVVKQPKYPDSIEATDVGAEPVVLVCYAALLEPTNQAIGKGNLPNFISYDQTSTTFQLVQHAAMAQGVALQPTFYSTSPEVIRRLVLAQKGVAALPYLLVKDLLDQGILALVSVGSPPVIERHIQVVQRRDKDLPTSVLNMAAQLRHILHGLATEALH